MSRSESEEFDWGRVLSYTVSVLCLTVAAFTALGLSTPARAEEPAAEPAQERVQVTDPFIELRTGPGRGYPVFFVAARNEWIAIELRHTDWFKVRTAGGKLGWVSRAQLESTLAEAGDKKTFRDLAVDDYLRRRVDLGAAWGILNSEPMLKVWTGYRLSDTLSAEATVGQMQGKYSGANFWQVNVISEPWSDRRFSPFFGIGVGRFGNFPNPSLVDAAATDANLANATLGARYYLSERFVVRLDYTLYTVFVSDRNTSEYSAFTAGLSFFF
jgi:hypothetical protein